jgi:hypothetical protein
MHRTARKSAILRHAWPAMSLGDSILHTASIARCVSVAGTATDHTVINPLAQDLDAQCRGPAESVTLPPVRNRS